MTFDLLKYTEDKVNIPDATLNAMLSAVIAEAGTEVDREGNLWAKTDKRDIDTILESYNVPHAREAFYAYCESVGIAISLFYGSNDYGGFTSVELCWSVQSVKEAKAKSTEDDDVMRNSRGEALLPLGSVVTFIEKSRPESYLRYTIVSHIALEGSSYPDHYVIERNGNFREVHYSEVTPIK